MGGLPDFYPGYQAVADPEIRRKFAAAWGTSLPDRAGMTAGEMLAAAGEGELKVLYILSEDPLSSAHDFPSVRRCLERCPFIVLQEIFPSRTSSIADVILPGVSFAEKTGTFTNTERRIQMVRQAIQPLGEARRDWQIIADLARRILEGGEPGLNQGEFAGWEYSATSQVMAEAASLAPIYAGVSHERLEGKERLQWPVESQDQPGVPILHAGRLACGLGRFLPVEHLSQEKLPA
jgi:predicted molibdopterin-dependent oxidoreductase YjgC